MCHSPWWRVFWGVWELVSSIYIYMVSGFHYRGMVVLPKEKKGDMKEFSGWCAGFCCTGGPGGGGGCSILVGATTWEKAGMKGINGVSGLVRRALGSYSQIIWIGVCLMWDVATGHHILGEEDELEQEGKRCQSGWGLNIVHIFFFLFSSAILGHVDFGGCVDKLSFIFSISNGQSIRC